MILGTEYILGNKYIYIALKQNRIAACEWAW